MKTGIAGLVLLAIAVVFAAGCSVPSVHPLYTDADLVEQPQVVGMWVDPDSVSGETWKFFKKPDVTAYTMIYSYEGVPARFDAHFTRIGDALYMDTWLTSLDDRPGAAATRGGDPGNFLAMSHLIPGHLFWRVELKEQVLRMAILDPEKLEEQLDAGTVDIAHEYQETPDEDEKSLILTASTAQLREFLLKSADKIFSDKPVEVERKPAKTGAAKRSSR